MYDQKVVRLVMQGDAKAFHRLYDDCADSVYAWAYDMLRMGNWRAKRCAAFLWTSFGLLPA